MAMNDDKILQASRLRATDSIPMPLRRNDPKGINLCQKGLAKKQQDFLEVSKMGERVTYSRGGHTKPQALKRVLGTALNSTRHPAKLRIQRVRE